MNAEELAAAPHYVYRLRDSDGGLLYIGCTVDPPARLAMHRCDRPWADLIATQDVEGPFGRSDALAREAAAITAEQPRFNVAHNLTPERWAGPSDAAFHYVRVRVCLSGRAIARAFWKGELPLRPTAADVRAWVQTLDSRFHAYPCPFAPDCRCRTGEETEAEYAAWAEAASA